MSSGAVSSLCGAIMCLVAAGGAADQQISWQSGRPLAWSDFRGTVAHDAEPRDVAVTATSLGWSYEYELELSGHDCSYRITAVSATATFHPSRSWVKTDHATPAVLAHEQGHFDITELHRRGFEALARGYLGATGSCHGRNPKRAASFIEADIGRIIGPQYELASQSHAERQARYDLETAHGMNDDAQRRWLHRIAAELRAAVPPAPY